MGSYAPRHLQNEPNRVFAAISRRGAAIGIGAAVIVPSLVAADLVTATSASASTNVVVLHSGSTGYYVKVVQKRLNIPQTSRFDARTLHAVKNFQRMRHLARDGYVGPNTWRALGGFPGAPTASKPSSPAATSNVVTIAKRYTGVPYVWGGSTPRGFDCSGFTSYVYRQVGRSLPRTADQQAGATKRVSTPRPGDLVFFGYPAHHVGIYVGNNQIIDSAKPGTRVHVHQIWGSHYFGRV
ncbi:NlpC/P60 family protein [Dermatophilaceae bacterium Sec6.4]